MGKEHSCHPAALRRSLFDIPTLVLYTKTPPVLLVHESSPIDVYSPCQVRGSEEWVQAHLSANVSSSQRSGRQFDLLIALSEQAVFKEYSLSICFVHLYDSGRVANRNYQSVEQRCAEQQTLSNGFHKQRTGAVPTCVLIMGGTGNVSSLSCVCYEPLSDAVPIARSWASEH
jgi:hypothetical protein